MVEESKAEPLEDGSAVEDPEKPWPVHEDTSEFEAILSPGAAAAAREEQLPLPADEPEHEQAQPEPEAYLEPEPEPEAQAAEADEEVEGRVALPPVNQDDEEPWTAN